MQIKILNQLILNQLEKFKKIDFLAIYKRQKKKIAISILILLLSLAYFLSLNARRRMAEDTLYWEKQSLLVKSLLPEFKSEGEIAGLLDKKYRELNLMASRQGQNILQLVTDYAQRMNIRIANIKTYPAQVLKQENNSTVVINSRVVQSLLVRMEVDSRYMNLVKYLVTLERVIPALITVERLKIKKDKVDPDKLKVTLELRFYSLSL